jgi:DNA-binding MarR family transcriptional regulator
MNLVERLRNPASRKSWMLADEQAEEAAAYIEKLESQIRVLTYELKDLKQALGEANE